MAIYESASVTHDILDVVHSIKEIDKQLQTPDRNGMISILQKAKLSAPIEITTLEITQGDRNWRLWSDFSDIDLYRKLPQYRQGLVNYCIGKLGETVYKTLMNRQDI